MDREEYEYLKAKYRTFGKSRSQRLKNFDYSSPNVPFYVTVKTKKNERFLNDVRLSHYLVACIDEAISQFHLDPTILCVMPNHYHILYALTELSGVSMFDVMKLINGRSGSFGLKIFKRKIWLKGCYDHVVRKDEDVIEIAKYISTNPQRWMEQGKYRLEDRFVVKWYIEV